MLFRPSHASAHHERWEALLENADCVPHKGEVYEGYLENIIPQVTFEDALACAFGDRFRPGNEEGISRSVVKSEADQPFNVRLGGIGEGMSAYETFYHNICISSGLPTKYKALLDFLTCQSAGSAIDLRVD